MGVMDAFAEFDEEREHWEDLVADDKFIHLGRATKAWMDSWPNQSSQTDILRASGMFFLCPREFVLNYWNPTPNKSFDAASIMKMHMGTAMHSLIQDSMLGPMGVLHGKWVREDPKGDEMVAGTLVTIKDGFHPDPERAVWEVMNEIPRTWTYVEPTVWNEQIRLSGHIDGVVCTERINWIHENARMFKTDAKLACKRLHEVETKNLALLEVKTTGSFQFKKINSSKDLAEYYKMQACIYQKLLNKQETVFWYIDRDLVAFKFFVYKHEPGWWNDARRKANIVWSAIRDETLPDSLMACKTPLDKRAKSCVHRDACWMKTNFKLFVEHQKKRQPDRKWLDMSKFVELEAA